MLKQRVITSLCGIPVLIAAIWFDTPLHWFTVLVAILGILAAFEFYRLFSTINVSTYQYSGIFFILLFIIFRDNGLQNAIEPVIDVFWISFGLVIALVGTLLEPVFWSWAFPDHPQKVGFKGSLWTVIGIVYIGWLLGHLVALRGFDDGRNWIFLALFATFAYDTAAYFTGRALGRHKMAPRLSPGKTWEGAAGGLTGAVLMSLFFTLSTPLSLPITWGHAVILGILISVFGQIGDLAESSLKRYTGVKDAGKIVPGHGGILDRLDSVVFTGAVVYYYFIWVIQ